MTVAGRGFIVERSVPEPDVAGVSLQRRAGEHVHPVAQLTRGLPQGTARQHHAAAGLSRDVGE
jgi:hypothetical protein